ncbi:MAG: FdhF/YdeP family oxidoreductase [Cellvibrionaceae bacterium]
MKNTVGGGAKKVLYTLNTVRRIGLKNSAKALTANNTCKACGLGMGGQHGGMTNELDEFPSVCNKSIQAQSTDIQPPIPSEIFRHSISELRELSPKELEHLGRLSQPLFKDKNTQQFREVSWDWAIDYAANKFRETSPQQSFFYSSGRSSNEAGFLLQLFARLYGTNNVTNCSYYCHQATSVALGSTIGTGTATVELKDLSGSDCIFVIGANPSSNHPRFIYQLTACRERGGIVVVINPAKEAGLVKFSLPKSPKSLITGGTEVASMYVQPHIGTDLALFKGIAKAIIEKNQHDANFIAKFTEGFETFKDDISTTSWETIVDRCGIDKEEIKKIAEIYSRSKNAVFAWGMGMTHHQFGSDNIEYIANLALLRGMIGKKNAGLLPLRGHSNVQGIGTIGVKPVLAPDVFSKIESELNVTLPTEKGLDTLAALESAHEGKIKAACIVGGNLYSATPDSKWAKEALDNISFKLYLTTTLNQGHLYGLEDSEAIILPVSPRDEEKQSTTQESMFNFVRLSDGGIDRIDSVRSEVSIISSLAKKVLPDCAVDFEKYGDHELIRDTISKTIPGMEKLKDIGIAKKEFHVANRIMHSPTFNTASQKAHFQVRDIPEKSNKDQNEFSFTLATIRSEGQFNSIIYEETDSYRYNAPRNAILMNPSDMQEKMMSNGDIVTLISSSGSLAGMQVQAFDLPKGNVMAYYPEANVLTERNVDERSKTPNFKSIRIAIKKQLQ